MVSQGEELALQLLVDGGGAVSSYFKHNSPLFEAEYRFIHGPLCGPTLHRAADEGDFLFPHLEALAFAEPPRDIHCIWELQVHRDRDLWLHFEKVSVWRRYRRTPRTSHSLTNRVSGRRYSARSAHLWLVASVR